MFFARRFSAGDVVFGSFSEEVAFHLTEAALKLNRARVEHPGRPTALAHALNHNLEIWVALRTTVSREDCNIALETRQNIIRLSQFVAEKTFVGVDKIQDHTLDALIFVDLQISEGLLEGRERNRQRS